MKKSQITLLILLLVFTGGIFLRLLATKKEASKEIKEENKTVFLPVRSVNNQEHVVQLNSHGQVTPYSEVVISSEVQGKLEAGNISLKPGTKFRTGQILYRINNEEAFYSFVARRASLANLILNCLPDIELDFSSEKDKWFKFMNELNQAILLPELPKINSEKERLYMTGKSIVAEYYNIKSTSARLDKYVIVAPFSGTVVDVFMEPGSIANPGAQIARIAKTGDYEVKVPISLDDLEFFKEKVSAKFTDAAGNVVGTGKIKRISNVVNQQTQSADVYYSIKSTDKALIYNGMYLNAIIDKKITKSTMTLPRNAVKDSQVGTLIKNKIVMRQVLVIGSKPDSVYVTGLKSGEKVLLEMVDKIEPSVIYNGVDR
jgi:multidrug efflux pump subunit AcrA (membrane-fusion protein)